MNRDIKDKDEKNVKISLEAHKKLKVFCAENDLNIKEFCTQLVLEKIEQEQKREKKGAKKNN